MAAAPAHQPVNIQRLLKENNRVAEATQYASNVTQGSIVAGWHESGPSAHTMTQDAATGMPQEAVLAKQELQRARKMRLQHLLESERLALETELHQRGLALTKHNP